MSALTSTLCNHSAATLRGRPGLENSPVAFVPKWNRLPRRAGARGPVCAPPVASPLPSRSDKPLRSAVSTAAAFGRGNPFKRVMRDLGEAVSGAVDSDQAGLVVDALVSRGIRCVAFDMDQTVVSKHSMGRLERGRFEWFLSHVTPGFKALVPKLSAAGIKLAIATASDKAEYDGWRTPQTYMLGEDLVEPLLKAAVPEHADEFFIVAYNPNARGGEGKLEANQGKLRHIRLICEHYGIPQENLVLLDDDDHNHKAHKQADVQFYSVKVDPRTGLLLEPLISQIATMPDGGGYVSLSPGSGCNVG